jgi:hypothetical protein
MLRTRVSFAVIASLALIGACSSDSSSNTTVASTTATTLPATTMPDTVAPSTLPDTTMPDTTMPDTTTPAELQMAIWPAAGVVFTTPEAAAADFLANVFGEGPVLGDFIGGDSRSGEIEVFASVDGAPIGEPRSVLMLRQLGPDDGWFVLGAASIQSITTPVAAAAVTAGPLTVAGVGTGFEATIVVSAFLAGSATDEFDRQVTMAGNFGESLPYSVELDLTTATSGDAVVLMVTGGTGLETDPGDFSAIPVVIG